MPESKMTPESQLRLGVGAVSTIGTLALLVKQLADIAEDIKAHTTNAPQISFAIMVAGLLFWSLAIVREALRTRSRVRNTDAFQLIPAAREQLIGRELDIGSVGQLVHDATEVHLLGPSGVGKSVFLRFGLIPAVSQRGMLPLYVNWWKGDWSDAPLAALAAAIWEALTPDAKTKLGLVAAPAASAVPEVLTNIQPTTGLIPLIILDDVEQWLAEHTSKFFTGGQLLPVKALVANNAFLTIVSGAVSMGEAHLLVARQPATPFPCFIGSCAEHLMEKPSRAAASTFLESLATSGAVEYPDRGWENLTRHILAQLQSGDAILPRHLVFVVRELPVLPRLTTGEFELTGGIVGLGARSIDRAIASIADSRGCAIDVLREAIRFLAAGGQPVAIGDTALAAHLTLQQWNGISSAMGDLAVRGVVRRALVLPQAEPGWMISHQLIIDAVPGLGADPNRWAAMLDTHGARYEKASGAWKRWHSLLSPASQLVLLFQRMRKNVRYGRHRKYVVKSMLRLVPYVLPALLFAYLIAAERDWGVPGGRATRDFLYLNHMWITRRTVSDLDVLERVADTRRKLIDFILSRRVGDWFQPNAAETSTHEPWIQAQASAALLRAPELKAAEAQGVKRPLWRLYADRKTDSAGRPYGFLPNVNSEHTTAEPLLWAISAFTSAWPYMNDAEQEQSGPAHQFLHKAAGSHRVCSSDGSECAWNMFSNLKQRQIHSTYSSALALSALLDMKRVDLPWTEWTTQMSDEGKPHRDRLIAATAHHLIRSFRREGAKTGWRASPVRPGPIDEGLTFQVWATLLRANHEAGVPVPKELLQPIPDRLAGLIGVASSRPPYTPASWTGLDLVNHKGAEIKSNTFDFRALWYPWAAECSHEWLRWARENGADDADLVRVRRARDYLLYNELPNAMENIKTGPFTFVGAETLYCLSSVR